MDVDRCAVRLVVVRSIAAFVVIPAVFGVTVVVVLTVVTSVII